MRSLFYIRGGQASTALQEVISILFFAMVLISLNEGPYPLLVRKGKQCKACYSC